MYKYQSSHQQFLNSTPSIGCWMFGAFKDVLFIMHFSRLVLVATYVNKEKILEAWELKRMQKDESPRTTCRLLPGAKPEIIFPRGGGKMFWSLDQLFQVKETNMFQMAYKYMYTVNN